VSPLGDFRIFDFLPGSSPGSSNVDGCLWAGIGGLNGCGMSVGGRRTALGTVMPKSTYCSYLSYRGLVDNNQQVIKILMASLQ
jgi:hypothetical protein